MNEILKKIDEEMEKARIAIKTSSCREERHGMCKFQDGLSAAKAIIQSNSGWIPVETAMPECEEEVLIFTERNTITTALYEDGKMPENESLWNWTDICFDYDEENDIDYIPEGWWEYRHFNPDDVYNNIIDEKVIAWQPLPEKFQPKGE